MRSDRLIARLAAAALVVFTPGLSYADAETARQIDTLLREVNMQRALKGVRPLKLDKRLGAAARKHARHMAMRDFLDHRSPSGRGFQEQVSSEGYPWRAIAENIGAGLSSPESTVDAWMTSPSHRDNMLNRDFNDAGIGYFRPTGEGKRPRYSHYWVILFGAQAR